MRLLVIAAALWLGNEWLGRWVRRQPDYVEWLRHGPSQHVSIFCLQS